MLARKYCRQCGEEKSLDGFRLDTRRKGLLHENTCRDCRNESRNPATQADIERANPVCCLCGERERWIDAVDQFTGSTWHVCRTCGRVNRTRSTWTAGFLYLDWVA